MAPPQDNTSPATIEMNGQINPAYHGYKEEVIEMREGDTIAVRLSADAAKIIADLSPRITVTFKNVSKVIDVPAKMIDPSSKERVIQRTLLDRVSGQILPGQVVALMGPSGKIE